MLNERALLGCLRWDDAGTERLRALTAEDWNALWQLIRAGAGHHLLARRLQRATIRPPDAIEGALRKRAIVVAQRNLAGRAALAAAIRATGRPALLLKGVDLAERLYGDLGQRPMLDIDFLVRTDDIAAYDSHLRGLGFDPSPPPQPALINSDRHHHTHYRSSTATDLPLELHWRLVNDERYRSIDVEGIWARSLPLPAVAPDARIMAPEDLFLYLCLHLKQHTFDTPLTQIWDLAEMLHSPGLPLDWAIVWQRAHDWHLTRTVKVALHLVSTTLGVPTGTISDWTPEPGLAALLPDVLSHLGRYPHADEITGPRMPLFLSSTSTWSERYRALRASALPPRSEIRALYGRPDDPLWRDCLSYLRGWRQLLVVRRKGLRGWLVGSADVRRHIDRLSALRRHLSAE
jgi:putative nucleotidyltransferase-like protein